MSSQYKKTVSLSTPSALKRVLLVIAHPDDESMFFLPLLHSLQSTEQWQTHLLCLSRGNYNGLGPIREKELQACASYIGLVAAHVHVVEDPKLQDHMNTQWDVAHIATVVANCMAANDIDLVFTFDDYGVSGHPNHIATYYGVKQALSRQQEKCGAATDDDDEGKEMKVVRGWALESTNIVRKYVGFLDTVLSLWLSHQSEDERQIVLLFEPLWNYNAMALHRSQFVWYRRLFIVFSRYTFINTFRPLLLPTDTTVRSVEHKKMQ